jgi:predicted nucleic acid-binding protein
VLRRLGRSDWRPNISVALALEYEEVLKRQGLVPGMSESDIDEFLDYLFLASNLTPIVPVRRPSLRDPDDERILEVAVHCGAMIITHNVADFVEAGRFGVAVKTPSQFLAILRQSE